MATNKYFNNFNHAGEQDLIEDLIIESIQMFGMDMFYLPRTLVNTDEIWRESPLVEFNSNYPLEMYIRDVQGFTGDGNFLSKFGLEIRDEITLTIAMKRFRTDVSPTLNSTRPREGDVIYVPLNGKAFQIKFVDKEAIFYQMGTLQVWDVVCEVFEFSHEKFNTGVPEIDAKFAAIETALEDGTIIDLDPDNMNDVIQAEADKIIDWTEVDPFNEGKHY